MAHLCQARLLLPQPKIFFQDGTQVFLTTICGRQLVNDDRPCCAACSRWDPIHGLVTDQPPATTHCYGSVWFEERLKAGAGLRLRDKLFLKAAAEAAAAGRIHRLRVEVLERPKEVKPRPRIIIKSMPPRKTVATAAAPPPPPSSPTHGSLPASPAVTAAVAAKAAPPKKKKSSATPSRKRSPTARIADRSPPAVAIGDDFQRTQQRTEALKSLLHVFEPAIFEEDDEPLEVDEYEYVKLHKVEGRDDLLQEEQTGAMLSYSMDKGILPL